MAGKRGGKTCRASAGDPGRVQPCEATALTDNSGAFLLTYGDHTTLIALRLFHMTAISKSAISLILDQLLKPHEIAGDYPGQLVKVA